MFVLNFSLPESFVSFTYPLINYLQVELVIVDGGQIQKLISQQTLTYCYLEKTKEYDLATHLENYIALFPSGYNFIFIGKVDHTKIFTQLLKHKSVSSAHIYDPENIRKTEKGLFLSFYCHLICHSLFTVYSRLPYLAFHFLVGPLLPIGSISLTQSKN